jgi:hypothetical protein
VKKADHIPGPSFGRARGALSKEGCPGPHQGAGSVVVKNLRVGMSGRVR